MRNVLTILAILGIAGPVAAAHDVGTPPGQAAAGGRDLNDDGSINGKDYAPGQSATEEQDGMDLNEDGKTNGKDYAPGQFQE